MKKRGNGYKRKRGELLKTKRKNKKILKASKHIKKCAQIHALRRAKERYDLDLTVEDLNQILNKIYINDVLKEDFILKTSDRRRLLIEYKNKKCWVVFSKRKQSILTFLPKEETRLTFNYKNEK